MSKTNVTTEVEQGVVINYIPEQIRTHGTSLHHNADCLFQHPGEEQLRINGKKLVMIIVRPSGEETAHDVSDSVRYQHIWDQFGTKFVIGEIDIKIFELTLKEARLCK